MLAAVSDAAETLATYQDLLALPEDVRAEILGGRVHTAPAPLPRHSRAQGSLRRFIGGPYDDDHGLGGPGGWWIFVEVDVGLTPHDIVRPDLSGWRRERLPEPWDARPIEVPPDWVCEVLSPATARIDKIDKRDLYAKHGIGHYWIVDVEQYTVEAFELTDGRWTLIGTYGPDESVAIPPFPETVLEIRRLFPPPA
jgi:Uma2 family endonuclease